jgi:hypothetical protein
MPRKKADNKQVLMNAALAFGGGIGAEVVSDLIAKQAPDIVQKNPEVTEIAPAAIGVGLLYFMPGKMDALAYGMIGASGAGMSDRIIPQNGFNRLTMQGNEADEYSAGREYMEEMMSEAFEPMQGEMMDGYGYDSYGSGMGY